LAGGNDDEIYPGVFCFLFERKLSANHRMLLRVLSDRLFSFLRFADRSEFQRRTADLQGQLAAWHSDLHSLRTALGTLGNKLHVLRINGEGANASKSANYVKEALECHAETLEYLSRLESIALSVADPLAPTFTLTKLGDLWRSQWKLPSHWDFDDESPDFIYVDLPFQLPGSAIELGQALYQFIDGALSAPSTVHEVPHLREDDDYSSPHIHVSLFPEFSSLSIWITTRSKLPSHVESAIHSMNVLGRLPSIKQSGGRGVLSAIQTIRTKYQGSCRIENSDYEGAAWQVDIPVTIIRQYRLFNNDLPQGDKR